MMDEARNDNDGVLAVCVLIDEGGTGAVLSLVGQIVSSGQSRDAAPLYSLTSEHS
jgi:hypothetical protein